MVKNKNFLVGYKLFFGLLGLSAIVTEIVVLVGRGTFNPANFFSFFTIESNVIAAFTLLVSALYGKQTKVALLRGAATTYMLIVGIGFALLLSGLENTQFTAVPWDNIVLHYIIPVAMVLDWLLDPPKARIAFNKAFYWLLFPVVYVSYTLIRGVIVGWYPYPFLDPGTKGYGHIAITASLLLVLGIVLIWLLTSPKVRIPERTK